jgi:hypothetical protein
MAKTILITGATAGFGEAMAQLFATKGHRLILTGRREDRLRHLKVALSAKTEVHTLCFDVRHRDEVLQAMASLPENWQVVDVLVNNAGLALGKATFPHADIDDWDDMIDTNVKGLLYMSRAALPFLRKAKQAHILNIGSIAGTEVYPGGNVYCASKHAVNAISKALRQELLPEGIRVSQIRPGLADTEFSLVRYKGDEDKANEVYKGFEALCAADVARAADFILDSPAHVCINDLEITPTAQANAFMLHKNE